MRKRIERIWRSNDGFADQYIALLICIPLLLMTFFIVCAGVSGLTQYAALNSFAGELAQEAADEGRTDGAALEQKYRELCNTSGMQPEVVFTSNGYLPAQKKVQYGDTIELTATLDTEIAFFGQEIVPIHLKVVKSAKSKQYWK